MHSQRVGSAGLPQRADRSAPTFSSFCLVAAVAVLSMLLLNVLASRYVGEPLPPANLVGP